MLSSPDAARNTRPPPHGQTSASARHRTANDSRRVKNPGLPSSRAARLQRRLLGTCCSWRRCSENPERTGTCSRAQAQHSGPPQPPPRAARRCCLLPVAVSRRLASNRERKKGQTGARDTEAGDAEDTAGDWERFTKPNRPTSGPTRATNAAVSRPASTLSSETFRSLCQSRLRATSPIFLLAEIMKIFEVFHAEKPRTAGEEPNPLTFPGRLCPKAGDAP